MAHFSSADPRVKSERARMKVIASENRIEVERLTAHLIRGLKRPATPGEEIEAELVAVAFVKARRLREMCRDDRRERRLLNQLMRQTVFGSVPAPSPAEIQDGTTNIVGPRAPGATYFVATKGGDPVTDEATAPDEVEN